VHPYPIRPRTERPLGRTAEELDTDVEWDGEDPEPPEERGNEDPAPNAP
jgi:hypothetical protein